MINYKGDVNIERLRSQLEEARGSLADLRNEFKDEPDLLAAYEPSALYLVKELERELSHVLSIEYGLNIETPPEVDFWVSLDGEEFKEGHGPIGQIGIFLTKLSNANKQAMAVISNKLGRAFKAAEIPNLSLVDTAVGSLKLGLRKPEIIKEDEPDQLVLFDDEEQANSLDEVTKADLPAKGMQLLVKALASVDNDGILNELKKNYGEKEVIKLIHYAKELAPSNRSPIDTVKFEGKGLGLTEKVIKTDKETRKKLTEHAKKLLPTTEFIEGTAYIGQADVNNRFLVARPLKYSGVVHKDIRCVFVNYVEPEDVSKYLNKHVNIKGYIVHDRGNRLLRLEIDDISLIENEDDE
jgi:hypothetical protein